MNKSELIEIISSDSDITREQAKIAVETILKSIKVNLVNGQKVSIYGFGTFVIKKVDARNGRNPRTGKQIKIQPKQIVKFKANIKLDDTDDTGPMKNN